MSKELSQAALLLLTKPVEGVAVFDRNFRRHVIADKIDDIERLYARYAYTGVYDVEVETVSGEKKKYPVKVRSGVILDSNAITGRVTVDFPLDTDISGDEKIRFVLLIR